MWRCFSILKHNKINKNDIERVTSKKELTVVLKIEYFSIYYM